MLPQYAAIPPPGNPYRVFPKFLGKPLLFSDRLNSEYRNAIVSSEAAWICIQITLQHVQETHGFVFRLRCGAAACSQDAIALFSDCFEVLQPVHKMHSFVFRLL